MKTIIEAYKKLMSQAHSTEVVIEESIQETSAEYIQESFEFDLLDGFLHLTEEQQMLVENRVEFLKTAMKDKIDFSHDDAGKHKDSDSLIDHIANKIDPTAQKVHTQWVTNQYRKGDIRQEDFPRVKKALKGFELSKKKLDVKDINQFKTFADLEDHVATQQHRVESEIKEKEKSASEKRDPNGLDKIHEDANGGVGVKINSRAASIANYGPAGKIAKTNWCTAANSSNNMFNHYKGGKYVYHTPENKVLQFHHASGQIMDERDVHVNLATNPAYAPHAEHIKSFINATGKDEGFDPTNNPSSLMQKTMSGMTQENVDKLGEKLSDRLDGDSWIGREDKQTLETHPYKPEVFSKAMQYIHAKGGVGGDKYSDHHEIAKHIAKNPNTPPHILDELHGMHFNQPSVDSKGNWTHSNDVKFHLSGNPATQGATRDAYKDDPNFATRRDLKPEEISHIVQGSDKDSKKNLVKNNQIHIPLEHQLSLKAEGHDILSRDDLHHSIADEHLADPANASRHVILKASPEAVKKHLPSIIANHSASSAYERPDLDEDSYKDLSEHVSTHMVRPEHAEHRFSKEIEKNRPGNSLSIPGIGKSHIDKAVDMLTSDTKNLSSIYTAKTVLEHPKSSDAAKIKILLHTNHSRDSDFDKIVRDKSTSDHLTQILNHPGVPHLKRLVASAKNVQKGHFDELIKDPHMHASIVASKSAPPSILKQLADSPSDYIKSQVKKHKNTPVDVKNSINVNEDNI